MARRPFNSIEATADQAQILVGQGKLEEAARQYRELIGQTHVVDYEYDDWLRALADVYRDLRRPREAAAVYLYLHYFPLALAQLGESQGHPGVEGESPAHHVVLLARIHEVQKDWTGAARAFRQARMPVHAAVALERVSAAQDSAAAWEEIVRDPGLRQRDYEDALAHFNLGMALARREPTSPAARKALIDSQRRLEQVADDFEMRGELERAFDCYQILLRMGKDLDQFENLAEGYVNCIRVLREDNLKFYVLQYYEDFIALTIERKEFHAAATLYQEAAEYASRAGLPYDRRYQAKAAETWVRCAEAYQQQGLPVAMAENALLAAAAQYSAIGNYGSVRTVFEKLSDLELPERARQRFATIATRYVSGAGDAAEAPGFPDYLRQQHAYRDIWFADLLEWELAGDPYAVAASIVGDLRYPNSIRRRALVVLLSMADAEQRQVSDHVDTHVHLAELLGELQSYAALAPLERLFGHPDAAVRCAAVRALRFLFFKRSFTIVRRALADDDVDVRKAALVAISGLHFPHALGPLARIYRESSDLAVRQSALEAIGKMQTVEAGELLISVLRQEEGPLQATARVALAGIDNADVLPIVRQHLEVERNRNVRDMLTEVVRRSWSGQ